MPTCTTRLGKPRAQEGELAGEFSPESTEGRMQNLNIQKGEAQLMHYPPAATDPESVLQALHSQHCSVNN